MILQGFSYEESARLMGCARGTVDRRLPDALDKLSEIFLQVGILKPLGSPTEGMEEACQEGEEDEILAIM